MENEELITEERKDEISPSEEEQIAAKGESIKGKLKYGVSGEKDEFDEFLYVTNKRLIFTGVSSNAMHRTDILIKDVESFSCATRRVTRPVYILLFAIFLVPAVLGLYTCNISGFFSVSSLIFGLIFLGVSLLFLYKYFKSRVETAYLKIFVRGTTQNIFEIGDETKFSDKKTFVEMTINFSCLKEMAKMIGNAIGEADNR